MATSTDLRAAIEEVQQQLPDEQLEALGMEEGYAGDWAERIQRRVGALPWWVVSTVVHAVIFLLATLLTVAMPPPQLDEVIISTDVAKQEEQKYDEKLQRDIFKQHTEIQHETKVDKPMVIHEEAPIEEQFQTDNDMDQQTARGHEDAISDIPLGGTGVTGSMGVGGGGMAGCFGYRDGGGRKRAIKRFGGSAATESAVEAALRWLKRHQEADGHWDIAKHEGGLRTDGTGAADEAVTGLALLAFVGAGYTHKAKSPYQDCVQRACYWLLKNQRADGGWSKPHHQGHEIYDASICTLAIAELYGMTRDARLAPAAQKGIDYLMKEQDPYAGWHHGRWKSTSVTGWVVMALKSARLAGLKVDGAGFQGATNWLNKVTDPTDGRVGYSRRGGYIWRSKGCAMTAVGMVSRQFMGVRNTDPMLIKQAAFLAANGPDWEGQKRGPQNSYYWYYGTLAMFQMGGQSWKNWNTQLKKTLLPNQCKGGPMDGSPNDKDGSWDPLGFFDNTGGRVYATATNALSLEVYYRYLPMYTK
ncbi:MAG: prenyltransferase/squalene oxidase repeat-containing protein [Planctomycetota bacterium]|jgi:hypothetical protein